MELGDKLTENPGSQPMFLSENYTNKPYMRDELIPLEQPPSSSKIFLQDLHQLDDHQFHANGSSSNPMFGVQTGSNFDAYDVLPYGSSTSMDFYDYYECKPFVDNNNMVINNSGHGQVMDNFQIAAGGSYLHQLPQGSPMDMVGSTHQGFNNMSMTLQEIKTMNFVIPDEVSSCMTANNTNYYKKVGMNKSTRAQQLNSASRPFKGSKKSNVVKGQWTIEEDRLLIRLVEQYGVRKWSHIAQTLPGRIGKQCRERWHNHLRPDIKKDTWSEEEDKVLIQAHAEIGNKWAEIAKRLPGRTENSIKNHWNATKRRQYSKRKCRSKYPRGTILQDYIKSLNLDSGTGRNQGKTSAADDAIGDDDNTAMNNPSEPQALDFCNDDRLVPNYDFSEIPEFEFDEKIFQDGCSIDSLLEEIPFAPVVEGKTFEMDVQVEDVTPLMDHEVKKELDLVEMISQAKELEP